jgi:hypothetical protein
MKNMTTLENQIIYVFNKFTKSFIREIKKDSDDVKQILKKNYICFDKSTDTYIRDFERATDSDVLKELFESEDSVIKDNEAVADMEALKDLKVGQIDNESKYYYLHLFYLLSQLHKQASMETVDVNIRGGYKAILVSILKIINGGYKTDDILDEIYDDRYRIMMKRVADTKMDVVDTDTDNAFGIGGGDDPIDMNMIHNTKIGQLAKDISSQIDVSSINPENIGNMNDLFSGENNAMSSIIQQVSGVMSDKMKNGEINQEELMSEAVSMMGSMQNSDMMESMMGMMKGMNTK